MKQKEKKEKKKKTSKRPSKKLLNICAKDAEGALALNRSR